MSKKTGHIPTYSLPPGSSGGIMMMHKSFEGSPGSGEIERPHRDGGYTFILQERGTTHIEIDFQTYQLRSPAVIFIRPGQVHRVIAFEGATISTWMVSEENLHPEQLQLLNNLTAENALTLTAETLVILGEAAALCVKLSTRKEDKLFNTILKDSCNTLVGLVASQFLSLSSLAGKANRFESVTNAFKQALEQSFRTVKRPAAYADRLNLSTAYLNECVKVVSGRTVSDQVLQRVVLEAKRLLYHSGKSVKEIAAELGYDDYSYFTRLFVKTVGVTPLTFRDKNHD